TQKEYYQIFAYFNNVPESGSVDRRGSAAPVIPLPTRAQSQQIAALNKAIVEAEQQLKANADKLRLTAAEWQRPVFAGLANFAAPLTALLDVPDHYLAISMERQALQKKLADTRKALEGVNNSVTLAMVMEERPQPLDTFVLQRGAYDKPGARVSPGVPAS